ncbi:MFS transporter [Parashewanella spongiae]|uniref:MFS transporter n=1 Tax=Parashewanella spongiae TaxID=342950 RepID=A0A3A6U5A4_9GAMM|nr:MFS transporter [Parashewanella spongiae]MCL1079122.1 MFS transporter [Parashewanella spongiae]RJY19391.1 MFS transporter [Parashewanella spongiae]
MANDKPHLSFWQIWNMCFGFLGLQFGFALQNANMSRIFQTLGAEMDTIPILWIAGPVTGLIVQPIIGHLSDKTWTHLGRRRPYFLYGAIVTSLALVLMPNASYLWMAAGLLWILDASINVSMEPFRAFVADNMPKKQQARGYSMQSFFIGIGAVVASMLPWVLAEFGVDNQAVEGQLPDTVKYAFYAGAVVLLATICWTVFSTKEYSPQELASFDENQSDNKQPLKAVFDPARFVKLGVIWSALGLFSTFLILSLDLDKQLYVLSGSIWVFGFLMLIVGGRHKKNKPMTGFDSVFQDLMTMPKVMKQLAVVQFFSWFALFAMWIYTTAAVTSVHFGSSDASTVEFNDGANWVGVLFATYNGFSALAALAIPFMVKSIGLRKAHLVNLFLGAGGLALFLVIDNPDYLLIAMVGVGFAWASILSLPYAMLAGALPSNKMGVYMGIFNFFIVIPQLLAASILGVILKLVFDNQPIYALLVGAISLVIAGLFSLNVSHETASDEQRV